MLKRLTILALCLLMTFSSVTAFGEEAQTVEKTYVMAGFDGENTYRSWDSSLFFARLAERTGVAFTYQQAQDSASWTNRKAQMTKEDADMPDIFFKADLTGNEMNALYEKGVLIDLKPLLSDNCPNLMKLLNEHPEYMEQIALKDGAIVSLPYISAAPVQNAMWINVKWLENLKLSKPTDLASLEQVLTAFKTKDPNQNGSKDEIPFAFLGAFDLKFMAHAFGLIANDYNIFADQGTAKFMPLEEQFRPFVEWCRRLYESGLLDKSGFSTTDSLRTVTDSKATKKYGMILTTSVTNILPAAWTTEYEILMPFSYEGKQVYRSFAGNLYRGTFAVTSACENPAEMLRWVDYFYSEEGAKLASVGLENEDYLVDGDGTWRLTEQTKSNYFTSEALITSGSTPPGRSADEFQMKYSDQNIAALSRQMIALNQIAQKPFPYYYLTDEQIAEISPLQNEIGYYVDMQIARWVLGEEPISDESFANFESTLKEKGLDDFMAFWQDVLNNL